MYFTMPCPHCEKSLKVRDELLATLQNVHIAVVRSPSSGLRNRQLVQKQGRKQKKAELGNRQSQSIEREFYRLLPIRM